MHDVPGANHRREDHHSSSNFCEAASRDLQHVEATEYGDTIDEHTYQTRRGLASGCPEAKSKPREQHLQITSFGWLIRRTQQESAWKHSGSSTSSRHLKSSKAPALFRQSWRRILALALFCHLFGLAEANYFDRSSPGSTVHAQTASRGRNSQNQHFKQHSAHFELDRHIMHLKTMAQESFDHGSVNGHLPHSMADTDLQRPTKLPEARDRSSNLQNRALLRSQTPEYVSAISPCATPDIRRRPLRGDYFEDEYKLESPVQSPVRQGENDNEAAVVCLDFDKTLSAQHVHNLCESSRAGMAGVDVVRAFGGPLRVKRLRRFLSDLRRRGAALYIVSRGHRERILEALVAAGLAGEFRAERVLGCAELRARGHPDKRSCAQQLGQERGLSRERVLLVDDDEEQLWGLDEEEEEEEEGFQGYWVESARGLSPADMEAILTLVDRATAPSPRPPRPAPHLPQVLPLAGALTPDRREPVAAAWW